VRRVQRAADPRVLFPGYIFGPGYWELQKHAYLLCVPTEVGGTHPILLEGLAAGNCILVNDYRPNAETVGDAGVYFSGTEGVPDLARQLERLLDDPALVERYRRAAVMRAKRYSWDAVTDEYEELLSAACRGPVFGPLPRELLDEPAPPPRAAA
jgi:glycosyltransferase involved in cell wall biosynthesis